MQLPSFTSVRVAILLAVLVTVGLISLHQLEYTRNWNQTLEVTVFPINADGHLRTDRYIKSLTTESFAAIDSWAIREAERFDLDLSTPFRVTLGDSISKAPPEFPQNANAISVIFWGLQFRWWAYLNTPDDAGGITRIRMFVMYHEGEKGIALSHSLGMQKGLMGLVHVFASPRQTAQNNIIIAHEILHTVGAIDKYNGYGGPSYPYGYVDLNRQPLYPQRYAEIMAGRIPTSRSSSYMAESLRSTQINQITAAEINWIE